MKPTSSHKASSNLIDYLRNRNDGTLRHPGTRARSLAEADVAKWAEQLGREAARSGHSKKGKHTDQSA